MDIELIVETLTQFISNVGFPIVACIFMFVENKKLTDAITKLEVTLSAIKEKIGLE